MHWPSAARRQTRQRPCTYFPILTRWHMLQNVVYCSSYHVNRCVNVRSPSAVRRIGQPAARVLAPKNRGAWGDPPTTCEWPSPHPAKVAATGEMIQPVLERTGIAARCNAQLDQGWRGNFGRLGSAGGWFFSASKPACTAASSCGSRPARQSAGVISTAMSGRTPSFSMPQEPAGS